MSGPGFTPQSIARRSRRPLMSSCALAAAMVAVGHLEPTRAQAAAMPTPTSGPSYLGTGVANVVGGVTTATITTGTTDISTHITVNAQNSIIAWTPTTLDTHTGVAPGTIVFQNAGTATFAGGRALGGGSYTVLNRIVPTANPTTGLYPGISFYGTTQSDAAGHIFFYSPGGILAGAGAVFDVGSLLLTTSNLIGNPDGSFTDPTTGAFHLRTIQPDNKSAIVIDQLATLRAAQADGSYIALVAPRINQAGTIRAQTGVALVAAESADLTIDNGLFSIAVVSGSHVDTPGETTLTHTGSSGDQTSTGGSPQAVYLVAVPKNAAVTMLVGGTLGYTAADSAVTLPNGVVVLSAGENITTSVFNGQITASPSAYTPPPIPAGGNLAPQGASLVIGGASFTDSAQGYAVTDATAAPGATGRLSFTGDLSLTAGHDATLSATAGRIVQVGGNLSLQSSGLSILGTPSAGHATLTADAGSTLSVSGSTSVTAAVTGNALLGDVTGGTAAATFTDANVTLGALAVSAPGTGADGDGSAAAAHNGTGGTSSITVNGGTLGVTSLSSTAQGQGGRNFGTGAGPGGNGTGGTASIAINGAAIDFDDSVLVNADGSGGNSSTALPVQQGTGTGGGIIDANGQQVGGAALTTASRGGIAGSLRAGTITVSSTGYGGSDGGEGFQPTAGGTGQGGVASLTSGSGAIAADTITVVAEGRGGSGGNASGAAAASGGDGFGGTALAIANGGDIRAGSSLQVSAQGFGGAGGYDYEFGYGGGGAGGTGGTGGTGTGGFATLALTGNVASGPTIDVLAGGFGGEGGSTGGNGGTGGGAGGDGGNARGGTATLTVGGANGSIPNTTQSLTVSGAATGGDGGEGDTAGGNGGNAFGGTAAMTVSGGSIAADTILVTTNGTGGNGGEAFTTFNGGTGGNGTGGTTTATANGGTIAATTSLTVSSIGTGGAGGNHLEFGYGGGAGNGGGGGAGFGMAANLDIVTGTVGAPTITVASDGNGGNGGFSRSGSGGSGGSGSAGTATASIGTGANNALTGTTLNVTANGNGASVTSGVASTTAAGGNASSGTAQLLGSGGHVGFTTTNVVASATGGNGNGGNGGNATATGSATVRTADTALALGDYQIYGDSIGGNGGATTSGGNATAGGAVLSVTRGSLNYNGGINLSASADGGSGGAAAGNGTGGTTGFTLASASNLGTSTTINAHSDGRGGTTTSDTAIGGNGAGGIATLDLSGITIAPTIDISANGSGTSGGQHPGSGTGGTATITASNNAVVNVAGSTLSIGAIGTGGSADAGATAGSGTGGGASIVANGATIDGATNTVLLALRGQGIGGDAVDNGTAGAGTGGTTRIVVARQNGLGGNISFGSVNADASGTGGRAAFSSTGGTGGGTGGAGTGGTSIVSVSAGTLRVTGETLLSIAGTGGLSENGGTGGTGTGGQLTISTGNDTGVPATSTSGNLDLAALTVSGRGTGGTVSEDGYGIPTGSNGGNGGAGTGGTATVTLGAGSFSTDATSFDLLGQGGAGGGSTTAAAGGRGGAGTGGTLAMTETGSLGDATTFSADVRGVGGAGGSPRVGAGGAGGSAAGGTARVTAGTGSTISTTGPVSLDAAALGGGAGSSGGTVAGGAGGGAVGGIVELATQGGTIRIPSASLVATATGGSGASGIGGNAGTALHAGSAQLTVNGGTLAIGGPATIDATASGGSGGLGGGSGFGGSAGLAVSDRGTFTYGGTSLALLAQGNGGTAGGTNIGGSGSGGTASLLADNTTLALAVPVRLTASGVGAAGGGTGTGGTGSVTARNNATLDFNNSATGTPGGVIVTAAGLGAAGARNGAGGAGTGGAATILAQGSTIATPVGITLNANGTGGTGSGTANGGAGTGGTTSTTLAANATVNAATLTQTANGSGGALLTGFAFTPPSPTGTGGAGTGGTAAIAAQSGTLTVTGLTALSTNGGGGASQGGGTGGAGLGGGATGTAGTGVSISTGAGGAFGDGVVMLAAVQASATGTGGALGEVGYGSVAGTAGGLGTGGVVRVTSGGGTIGATTLTIDAHGTGGDANASGNGTTGKAGGDGIGGTVAVASTGGGFALTSVPIDVTGIGGAGANGGNGGDGGNGGAGTGGQVQLATADRAIALPAVIQAYGQGGAGGAGNASIDGGEGQPILNGGKGGIGGIGTGGFVTAQVSGGQGTLDLSGLAADTHGQGGIGGAGGEGGTGAGGGAGGAGGAAQGGRIDLTADAGTLNLLDQSGTDLTLLADARGGKGGAGGNPHDATGVGGTGGAGGDATAGTSRIGAIGGSVDIGTVVLSANARGGDGGFGGGEGGTLPAGAGGNGGSAQGGLAELVVGTGVVDGSSLTLTANGTGGNGSGSGAQGGTGTGGTASIGADTDPTIDSVTMTANGLGGSGGGGTVGGNGGDGFGGTVNLSTDAALQINSATLTANGTGGGGGAGLAGNGGNGGVGIGGGGADQEGNAVPGGITIAATGEGGALTIGTLSANADGQGGAGGQGATAASGAGGSGGSGGFASGGAITLSTGNGGSYGGIENGYGVSSSVTLNALATGGDGGTGTAGTIGGAGGNGGLAVGGIATILADTGTITINSQGAGPTIDVSATGGAGRAGSDGSNVGDTGGVGGNGGDAHGGSGSILSTGGALALGDTTITARGTSGLGQSGGLGAGTPAIPAMPGDLTATPPVAATPGVPAGPTTQAGGGFAGNAFGGAAAIHVADQEGGDATGTATLGNTTIDTGSSVGGLFDGFAGRVEVYDSSTATDPTLTLNSLTVNNIGGSFSSDQAVDLFADNTRVNVTDYANITAGGPGYFRANGTGGFDIANALTGNIDGDITISHDNQPAPMVDTIHAGDIQLTTLGSIHALTGSVLRADRSLQLDASGGIDADTLYATDLISARSGGNLSINNAIASGAAFDGSEGGTGTPGGGRVLLSAGSNGGDPASFGASSVTVTGTVSAPGSVEIDAGADVTVNGGGRVFSDNRVTIAAGNDIQVDSGGEVRAALNPIATLNDTGPGEPLDTAARLTLTAGRLPLDYTPDPGNVATINVDGTISAAGRPVFLAGGTIIADANPIDARSLIVEVDGAPAPGAAQLNDNGRLTRANCLQGDVCLGNLRFDRLLMVGGAAGTTAVLPTRLTIAQDAGAQTTSLRAQGDITVGTTGQAAAITGGDLLVQSTQGSIDLLGGSSLTGGDGGAGQFRVLAAGDVTGGSLAATGDAQLGIGGSLNVDGVSATGGLTTLDQNANVLTNSQLSVSGSIGIGTLSLGAGDANLVGPAGISVGTAEVANGHSVNFLSTGGDVSLNSAGASGLGTPTDIALQGNSVTAGALAASDMVTLVGSTGGVDVDSILAGGNVVVDGNGTVRVGTASATGTDLGSDGVPGSTVTITARSGGTLTTGDVSATGDLSLASLGGGAILTGALNGADVTAGSSAALTVGSATATQSIALSAVGPLVAGPLMAGGGITLAATGGDITLDRARAGGTFDVNDGQAFVAHDLSVGADLSLSVRGAIMIDTLNVAGNASARSALADVSIGTATVGRDLVLGAGSVTGSGDAMLTLGNTTAGTALLAATGAIQLNGPLTTTLGDALLRAGGAITGGAITTFGTFDAASDSGTLRFADISAGNPASGGGIALAAQDGITTGALTASNSILANSTAGPVSTLDIASSGGSARIFAGGDMTVGNVRTAGSIFLTGTAAIHAGNLTAGTGALLTNEQGTGGNGGTDPVAPGIAAGFDESAIARCDDCFTSTVPLPFDVNYFGRTYSATFVSNNGYLTFNSGQGAYTPSGLGADYVGQPIVAAFFADVDTRNPGSAQVTYGNGTYGGRQAFGATYENVGYFSNAADKLNDFQIILTNRSDTGAGNFDIYYNYGNITWETGAASGGVNGFGGVSAAVGYNAGTGNQAGTYFELAGSRVPGSFINGGTAPLNLGTNDGNPGQLLFSVRNGQVSSGAGAEPPTIHVTNIAAGNSADVTLGNLSAEAAEVHGAGRVTVGDVSVADRGSGIAATGQAFATVLDATTDLLAGNLSSTGLIALGASQGNVSTGSVTTAGSALVLAGGTVILGPVSTGLGASDSLFISGPSILGSEPALAGVGLGSLLGSSTFDPHVLASLRPVQTGGAITLGTPISTGNFLVASAAPVTLDALGVTNRIFIDSAGFVTTGNLTAGGSIEIDATGNVRTGDLVANGPAGAQFVAIGIDTGGNATIGNANAAAGDIALAAGGTLTGGALQAGGAIALAAAGDIMVASANAGGLLYVGNSSAIAGLNPADGADFATILATAPVATDGNLTITTGATAGSIDAAIGGAITAPSLVATQGILLAAGGDVTVTTANAGTTLAVNGANIQFDRATATGDADLTATGTLAVTTDLAVGGTVNARGTAVALNSQEALTVGTATATTGGLGIETVGTLTVASATAPGTIRLTSSAGSVILQDASTLLVTGTALPGGTVTGQAVSIDPIGATGRGDILVTAAQDARLNGTVTARNDVNATAGGTVTVNGQTLGQNIALASADVSIGSAAVIGSGTNTTSVTFTDNKGGTRTYIGDTGGTDGYRLDNSEFARVRAQSILINGQGSATASDTPDVTIGNLTIVGSASATGQTSQSANLFGSTAGLTVTSPGTLRVAGNVLLSSAGAGDHIDLNAGTRLDLITPTASVTIADPGNAITGKLNLAADTILISSAQAATDLAALTTLDAKSQRLGMNEGAAKPEGYIQAGGLSFSVGSGLFVQNSGDATGPNGRAGLTVGSGGIQLIATGTRPQIVINGRQISTTATGGFVTGRALIPVVNITGGVGSVDGRSTVNGCLLLSQSCGGDGIVIPPVQDVIDQTSLDGATNGDGLVQAFNVPIIQLIDIDTYGFSPSIDEPVTGAGNDDLWTFDCTSLTSTDACPREGMSAPTPGH